MNRKLIASWAAAAGLALAYACLPVAAAAAYPFETLGDTLTVIQRPLPNLPAIVTAGEALTVSCAAAPGTTGWALELRHGAVTVPLPVTTAVYDAGTTWWTLQADVPAAALWELHDLAVTAAGGVADVARNAVRVIPARRTSWYFVHVTDTHLPTHLYYYEAGAETDSTEMEDLRAVIQDLNIINPEFVLLTGDLVNEGELEDFLTARYYSRAQRLLREFEVPVYLSAGNHDLGGWDGTPPSDGTARRDWWRFFGWPRLDDPPPGAPARTQDYSFDYGPVHFVSLEAYNNYDDWRYSIYGTDSFTSAQVSWLQADLAAASGSAAQVLFTHYDFANELNLSTLGLEMSLAGHTHSNGGSLTTRPYDLITAATCDGKRTFRLVRVAGSEITPRATLAAGATGQNLRVTWTPANDGSNEMVTAQVINTYAERFQNGLLKFRLPKGPGDYLVEGGTLLQVDLSGAVAVVHVEVDIAASATTTVTAWYDALAGVTPSGPADLPRLEAVYPNPFNPRVEAAYELPRRAAVRLTVHDARGRQIAVLVDEALPAGRHLAVWDGRDGDGAGAPSGVYFLRLEVEGEVGTRKAVLAR